MSTIYTVGNGETIMDVSINATGSPNNVGLILDANNIDSWTPVLLPGQEMIIPDNVEIQPNNLLSINVYPVSDCGFISGDDLTVLLKDLDGIMNELIVETTNRTFHVGDKIHFTFNVYFSNGDIPSALSVTLPVGLSYTISENVISVSGVVSEPTTSDEGLMATCPTDGITYINGFSIEII